MFEGSNRHFDQTLCMGLSITDEDIDSLCQSMKEQAVKNANNEVQKESVKEVGRQQLRSWGILIERDGPIWEQIEQAFQYVLRNIHLGANIVGIYRQDVYEIPPDAIRELIINAAVHRSYLDHGNIQVAIYDDRLEITSPGKLPMGQTLERMKEGYSQIRNEALASAFYMNLIEHWGSGIPRIIGKVKAAGLREPVFIGGEVDLRINIYRNNSNSPDNSSYPDCVRDQLVLYNEISEECRRTAGKPPENCREVSRNKRFTDTFWKMHISQGHKL